MRCESWSTQASPSCKSHLNSSANRSMPCFTRTLTRTLSRYWWSRIKTNRVMKSMRAKCTYLNWKRRLSRRSQSISNNTSATLPIKPRSKTSQHLSTSAWTSTWQSTITGLPRRRSRRTTLFWATKNPPSLQYRAKTGITRLRKTSFPKCRSTNWLLRSLPRTLPFSQMLKALNSRRKDSTRSGSAVGRCWSL